MRRFQQVDVFTDVPFQGNPVAVVDPVRGTSNLALRMDGDRACIGGRCVTRIDGKLSGSVQ